MHRVFTFTAVQHHTIKMDTPKFPPPSNEGEQEILQNLELVLAQLQIRRADRANYVRSQDVMELYDQTIEQVRKLTELRQGKKVAENRGMRGSSSPILQLSY